MHYVRKLGFEETPEYDFLRELFTKVLRSMGEEDDGIYDWMLLNNGKGWETLPVSSHGCLTYERSLLDVLVYFSRPRRISRHMFLASTDETATTDTVARDSPWSPILQLRRLSSISPRKRTSGRAVVLRATTLLV
jgi:hypothetical protein